MPMSQTELMHWKAQLSHADRVWYQAGLIEGVSGQWRSANTVPIYRYIQDYRGDQSEPFASCEKAPGDPIIANLTFSITNTVIAVLSGRDPEPIVKAKGGSLSSEDASRRARLNKIAMTNVMREQRYKREVDRALQSALTTPFGIVQHGYTASVEEFEDPKTGQIIARFKNEKPDFPWIRHRAPWDIRIDPLADQFDPDQSPRWVMFRDVYTELEITKNPKIIKRRDWTPTFTPYPYSDEEGDQVRRLDNPDVPKLYETWTVYDAIDRKVFAISPGSEKEVREADDWPIEWGQLPYSILTLNEQLDSPIGIPFPKLYAHEQEMYNRIWTIINMIISRTRRIVFVSGEAFQHKADQKENLFDMKSLQEFIEVDGDVNNVVREIALGIIDPQLIALLYHLREQVREVIGISQFDRGQRANVETAAEASQIGAGAAVQKSRIQEKHELFWKNIMQVTHRAMHQIRDDRKLIIPLLDEKSMNIFSTQEQQQGYVKASLADLQGDFDIAVRLNSTLPLDTRLKFAQGMAVFQGLGGPNTNMLQQMNVQRDLVDLAEFDPDRWVINEQMATNLAQQAQQGEAPEGSDAGAKEAQGSEANAPLSVIAGRI